MSQPVLKAETKWGQPSNVAIARESILSALKEASGEGPGDYLRQLREVAKLEINEVATQLGLHKDQVIALENNDYDKLPAPIYVKGFYRRYCNLLAIAADPVITAYDQNAAAAIPELNRVTLKANSRPVSMRYLGYTVAIVLLLAMLYMLQGVDFSNLWGIVAESGTEQPINTATELNLPQVEEVPFEGITEPQQ